MPWDDAACVRAGCDQQAVVACGYIDGAGRRCGVRLCRNHCAGLFCPRHAVVGVWLTGASATLRPHRPAIDDRTASLLLRLAAALEQPLVTLLRSRNVTTPGVEAAADGLAELRRAGELAWEFGWSAYTAAGHLDHIAIRAGAGEPPRVRLLVNQNEVFAEVPYSITRRLAGSPADARDLDKFTARLVAEATNAVGAAHAAISWLPAS